MGLDVWNLPALQREYEAAQEESQRLDAVDAELSRRIAIKDALVDELIAGRATLAEVTERFYELNRLRPQCLAVVRESYPGATDMLKHARNVMEYALARVTDPSTRDTLARRLEAELTTMERAEMR